MEKKIHYKMHKAKKNWVAIGTTTLALINTKGTRSRIRRCPCRDVKQVVVQEPATARTSDYGSANSAKLK